MYQREITYIRLKAEKDLGHVNGTDWPAMVRDLCNEVQRLKTLLREISERAANEEEAG